MLLRSPGDGPMKTIVTTILFLICAFSLSAQAQKASTYLQFGCDQCHGRVGQGGAAGLRLAPDPLPYEDFADIVRRPYGVMPAYSPNVISDADLAAIYSYLEAIPEPPSIDVIPLLQLD